MVNAVVGEWACRQIDDELVILARVQLTALAARIASEEAS